MTTKKIILKSWWHEDLASETDKNKLERFTQDLRNKVNSEFDKPEGPSDIFEGDEYFFYQSKHDRNLEINVTTESIDITFRHGQYDLSELIAIFKKCIKETIEIHNSLGLVLDHYHFFIETLYYLQVDDIRNTFIERLGLKVQDDFLESSLGPASSNVHYLLDEGQSVIISLILKDFEKKSAYEYKIKVDAGKIKPNFEMMKECINRTEQNFINITKSIK